jgi:uncharacterized alpha-E superfamily protein
MLSRVAESIYWMQRYIERAENVSRFVSVNVYLSLDMPDWVGSQWMPLVQTTGDHELFAERYGEATESSVLEFLLFDEEYPNSVISCLKAAKENARSIQEAITSDVYESLNLIVEKVQSRPVQNVSVDVLEDLLQDIKNFSHFVSGCMSATFSHDEAWQFKTLGGFLERADKTTRILDVKYFYLYPSLEDINTPLDNIPWFSLLNSTSALEMYMRRHGLIKPKQIIEFLLLDPTFARSAIFCVEQAHKALLKITGNISARYSCESEKLLGALYSELKYQDPQNIIDFGMHEYLDFLQFSLNDIGGAIQRDFFIYGASENSENKRFGMII